MISKYIQNYLTKLSYVQIGDRTISLSNRTVTIEYGCLVATHPEGEVKVIPLDKIDEFNFDPEKNND